MTALETKLKELQLRAGVISYVDTPKDAQVDVTDEGKIKGYLIAWGVKDDRNTVMVKGCCAKSIRERGPESTGKYKIKLLWQHDQKDPLCVFDVLKEDDYGLYFEATPDDVPNGKRALLQLRTGTLNQFSVGFNYVWDKVDYDTKQDALLLREIDLFEGTIATIPSNMETYAIRSVQDFEAQKELLLSETEDFIKSIPRNQQLELRQIIARNISLSQFEPDEQKQISLRMQKPNNENAIDYSFLTNNFSLTD